MSLPHATRPKEGAPPRSTRQLLDELDTLMNQMLALPVEDDPTGAPPPSPVAKPTLAATLTMLDADGEAQADAQILPLRVPPTPAAPVPKPAAENPSDAPPWTAGIFDDAPAPDESANKPASGFALVDLEDEAATDSLLAVDIVQPRPAPKPRHEAARRPMPRSSASWTTGTLVVWDRGFRRWTRRLGFFGSLLRTAGGRVVLGVCGLSFWMISLAWLVLDWLRWTR